VAGEPAAADAKKSRKFGGGELTRADSGVLLLLPRDGNRSLKTAGVSCCIASCTGRWRRVNLNGAEKTDSFLRTRLRGGP
jgi:hypothetical protein